MDVTLLLQERGTQYGDFDRLSAIAQGIKSEMAASRNWEALSDPLTESLEMIACKIARILNGNPYKEDSWEDIAGYAQLALNEVRRHNAFVASEFVAAVANGNEVRERDAA